MGDQPISTGNVVQREKGVGESFHHTQEEWDHLCGFEGLKVKSSLPPPTSSLCFVGHSASLAGSRGEDVAVAVLGFVGDQPRQLLGAAGQHGDSAGWLLTNGGYNQF